MKMADKSKSNETSNVNDPSVLRFSEKWFVTLQGMKKKDLWAVLQDLQKTLKEQGVIKSIPSKEEDEKLYKSMTGKTIIESIIMSAQDEMNALVMTVSLEKFTGTEKPSVEDKNAEYEAILNEEEGIKVESTNPRKDGSLYQSGKSVVTVESTNPRKDGPVTKAVKEVLEDIETQDSSIVILKEQKEIEATVAYVNARYSDDPVTQEAVQEFEQETITEVKGATDLLKQGSVDRTGLKKNGTPRKRGTGVIATIAEILRTTNTPLTKDQILNKLLKQFPDRDSSGMETTVGVQVPVRMSREKQIDIVKVDCGTDTITKRTRWGYMVNSDLVECIDEVNGYYELKSVKDAGEVLNEISK